jgi:hypothetical protein
LIRLFTVLLVELWEETAVPTRCDYTFPMQRISKMVSVQKVSKCVEFWRDGRGGRRMRGFMVGGVKRMQIPARSTIILHQSSRAYNLERLLLHYKECECECFLICPALCRETEAAWWIYQNIQYQRF